MIKRESFEKILKCTQIQLKKIVKTFLENKGFKPLVGDGFVYAKGEIPILLVAHLDTVHTSIPNDIYYDAEKDVMWSPQGIGGDDRCGVFAILKILENYKPYVLFTEDEEKGCIGAKKVVETIIQPDVKFIVEIDRRGSEDCVFYDCGNKKFQAYIEGFGFTTALGSYSDIVTLSDYWEIASVNLSSGYYNEHTFSETIKIKELEATYNKVRKILEDDDNNKEYFDYEKKAYKYLYNEDKKENKTTPLDYMYSDKYGYVDKDGEYHYWDDDYEKYEKYDKYLD